LDVEDAEAELAVAPARGRRAAVELGQEARRVERDVAVTPDRLAGKGQHVSQSLLECDLGGVSAAGRPAHHHALLVVERDLCAGLFAPLYECGVDGRLLGPR